MNAPAQLCRECRKDISEAVAGGDTICPWCGCPVKAEGIGGMSRGWLWALFWAIFLGTPVLALVSVRVGGTIPIFLTGAFVAGGILSRLFTKTRGASVGMTLAFGVMLLVVYGGIAFAGCMIALNGARF
jgi:hypothetical protein